MTMRTLRDNLSRSGFTLIEVVAAVAIFAIVFAALYAVVHAAIGLKASAEDRLDATLARTWIAERMTRDLAVCMPPSGVLAGGFLGEQEEFFGARRDVLEMHAASAALSDDAPWGDVERVAWRLTEDEDGEGGFILTRETTPNLLASIEEDPEVEKIARGLTSLAFTYFDGDEWLDAWDSGEQEDALPEAVRVRIEFAETEDAMPAPLEIVTPLVMRAPAAEEEDAPEGEGSS